MKILVSILLGITSLGLHAQDSSPAIPTTVAKKALQWMQNADPSKRAAAYRTFQLYGDEGGVIYRGVLEQASELHTKKLADLLDNDRSNPFAGLPELAREVKDERKRIYALVKTDFKKNPAKITMLRNEVDSLAALVKRSRKFADKDSQSLDKSVTVIATAMAEVSREMNLIDKVKFDRNGLDTDGALRSTHEGETYLTTGRLVEALKKEISDLSWARSENEACTWANKPQKQFTHYLNDFRSVFALTPLLLEEKLSAAAVGHSRDMAAMGFFAHQSPIPEKKSPGDRARLAGFKHSWRGENIFRGSSSPVAAYDAWFGSDGHRFGMYADGPNLIGIGPHGKHWTMMTGRK